VKDLELKNVTKKFGSFTAVENFSMEVDKGEFVSFLGPSGCGKTTILRMIAGFIDPTEGEIYILGQKVNDVPPYHRDTGLVFQNYALFPHLSVFDNIAFGLKYRKVPKGEIKERVSEMLELVRLPGLETRKPSELSGGQQQRIAMARALVIKPKLLLLDEPLSNLDAKLRENLRVELRQIQQEVGITSIFVTHDQEEALALSDRTIVMNEGKITQIGTPTEIYEEPQSVFVAQFIGQSNFLDGKVSSVEGNKAMVDLQGEITIGVTTSGSTKKDETAKVLIRAERINIKLEPTGKHLEDGMNILKGTIENTTYLGSNIYYYIRLENNEKILVIEQTAEKKPLSSNDEVFLEIQFASCWSLRRK
jgi:putative spermidine/putrescine transport system ATP-binding protein